jgi:hypothetical protein
MIRKCWTGIREINKYESTRVLAGFIYRFPGDAFTYRLSVSWARSDRLLSGLSGLLQYEVLRDYLCKLSFYTTAYFSRNRSYSCMHLYSRRKWFGLLVLASLSLRFALYYLHLVLAFNNQPIACSPMHSTRFIDLNSRYSRHESCNVCVTRVHSEIQVTTLRLQVVM